MSWLNFIRSTTYGNRISLLNKEAYDFKETPTTLDPVIKTKKMRDPAQVAHYYFETILSFLFCPFENRVCITDANFFRFLNLLKKSRV